MAKKFTISEEKSTGLMAIWYGRVKVGLLLYTQAHLYCKKGDKVYKRKVRKVFKNKNEAVEYLNKYVDYLLPKLHMFPRTVFYYIEGPNLNLGRVKLIDPKGKYKFNIKCVKSTNVFGTVLTHKVLHENKWVGIVYFNHAAALWVVKMFTPLSTIEDRSYYESSYATGDTKYRAVKKAEKYFYSKAIPLCANIDA